MTTGKHTLIAATGSNITAQFTVGNYTSIGPYVQMHALDQHSCIQYPELVSTKQLTGYPPTFREDKPIVIGSDVWIGRGAILLGGGITIGHGAIIGAFAVVAKDVPPYAVVVGNPAIIKRYRFTPEQIEKLLKIKWWDWDDNIMEERKDDFKNINSFVNKYSI